MRLADRVLARRYARALYECAVEDKTEDATGREIAEVVRKLAGGMAAFQHPQVGVEEKKRRLRAAAGEGLSSRTLRFLDLLIKKKRFGLLPLAAADFSRLYDEDRGIAYAKVRAAAELSGEERRSLEKRLGGYTGKTVTLDVTVDPELIAGVVVRIGDLMFDASLKGELRRMRAQLAAL